MDLALPPSLKQRFITLGLISKSDVVIDDVQAIVAAINRVLADSAESATPDAEERNPIWRELWAQARSTLTQNLRVLPTTVNMETFGDVDSFSSSVRGGLVQNLELIILDLAVAAKSQEVCESAIQRLLELCHAQASSRFSPHSVMVMTPEGDFEGLNRWLCRNRLIRVYREGLNSRTDLLRTLMDHLDHSYCNKMLARTVGQHFEPVSLAQSLFEFMSCHWGENWDCHYFTGSMVSGFIQSVHQLTQNSGIRCLSGCSEHSLAVSALAGWQLFQRASIIVVTSGMLDEFRGTLANLKRAGVPCFVVCADSPGSMWFAFQGTMDVENDGRKVIQARGLTEVFIDHHGTAPALLAKAFQSLLEKPQPVFILATQSMLEYKGHLPIAPSVVQRETNQQSLVDETVFSEVLSLINNEQRILLWQCGPLDEEEKKLVLSIARRAGVLLADSLTAPGSIAHYENGKRNSAYLGTLAMYGFNRRIFYCLHDEKGLKDSSVQSIFFLKSRVDQAATPFSEAKLKRQLHIVQINRNADHISPFSNLPLVMDAKDFLKRIHQRLAVEPEVLAWRNAERQRLFELVPEVPTEAISTWPMTVNYFFTRLGQLLEQLIEKDGYHYLGVYDVGRCGLSAIRNCPRTRRGLSGWYGRALMGDALVALPYIALNTSDNILAFIGDGARALVPNIESWLVEKAVASGKAAQRNITVFYLNNGVLSLIQTYLDKRYSQGGTEQVRVRPVLFEPATIQGEGINIHRECISLFDRKKIHDLLTAVGQINFLDVTLSHNSEGDGLSLVSESSWDRKLETTRESEELK